MKKRIIRYKISDESIDLAGERFSPGDP